MRLIYATGNPGKLTFMRDNLDGLVTVASLSDYGVDIDVDESGKDPLENARIKAEAYYAILKRPVLAADSGLYIDGLSEREQPGVHVRRVGGRRLSDAEMIAHYAAVAARMGGRARAHYRNGLCLIAGEGHVSATDAEEFAAKPFYLVARPHAVIHEGFPLDSVSVEIASGKYFYDLADHNTHSMFWRQAYRDFVVTALTGLTESEYVAAMRKAGAVRGGCMVVAAEEWLETELERAYARPGCDVRGAALAAIDTWGEGNARER